LAIKHHGALLHSAKVHDSRSRAQLSAVPELEVHPSRVLVETSVRTLYTVPVHDP